ncbi:hypothetical protein KVR01_006126 [Diaporthe batatas]|uniref:uncharacterized protein n=1 Tax=Diaporthe batatas TaxID=748121 RepID=UPI001D0569C6|nr:uncharacterized protein KVR01_006126 [Diaporthe batatas]KAG8164208.1 hypothetical protein KVR01_006126 [Diaporthe batatas]
MPNQNMPNRNMPNQNMPKQNMTNQKQRLDQLEATLAKKIKRWKEDDKEKYADRKKAYGGRFLENRDIIHSTRLYELAKKAPKGGHLHIHFNSCLGPDVLLNIATDPEVNKRMYISTDLQGPLTADKLDHVKIKFHFMASCNSKSVFETGYIGRKRENEDPKPNGTFDKMLFSKFRTDFESKFKPRNLKVMDWLKKKLIFSSSDVQYEKGDRNSCKKQWDMFDARTQMMAGLFNYEHAYRKYTRLLLDSFHDQNIQYAEIRPNFMPKNQVYTDADPNETLDNYGVMDLIIEEYEKWKDNNPKSSFRGLKVIYCTPRSFPKDLMQRGLDQCFDMKTNPNYSRYIAGFDIIGREDAPDDPNSHPLSFFKPQLLKFQEKCKAAEPEIYCPFLFHAGESHEDPLKNLDTALDLGSKRIAHGYSITQKGKESVLLRCEDRVKAANAAELALKAAKNATDGESARKEKKTQELCIECCPISNEILGLHPDAKGAVVYDLMNNKIPIPCALASDNPTLFQSTLADDHYQALIGRDDFGLPQWKQLIKNSINHGSWNNPAEHNSVMDAWERAWFEFVKSEAGDGPFFDEPKPKPKPNPPTSGTAVPDRPAGGPGPTSTTTLQKPTHGAIQPPARRSTQDTSRTASDGPRAAAPKEVNSTARPHGSAGGPAPTSTTTLQRPTNRATLIQPPTRRSTQDTSRTVSDSSRTTALKKDNDTAGPHGLAGGLTPTSTTTSKKPTNGAIQPPTRRSTQDTSRAVSDSSQTTALKKDNDTLAAAPSATGNGAAARTARPTGSAPSTKRTARVAASSTHPSAGTSTPQASKAPASQTRRAQGP